MDIYVLVYRGQRRISALRAVRTYTGLSLVEAKRAIENPQGFVVHSHAADSILSEYFSGQAKASEMMDWKVSLHDGYLPIDLRSYPPPTPL